MDKKILITVTEELGQSLKIWSAKMKTTQTNLIQKMIQAGINQLENAERSALGDSHNQELP